MPNSLRCKIKKWCYQGKITEKERDRLIQGLDASDKIKKIDDIKAEVEEKLEVQDMSEDLGYGMCLGLSLVLDIIDKHMKEGDA